MFKLKKRIITGVFSLTLAIVLSGCGEIDEVSPDKEVLGNPNASVSVQIYSDLECPACAQASTFLDVLIEKFPDQLKITYHHFPLESIHPDAFGAAVAAECAGKQGKFWKFVKYAYKFQKELDTKNLKKHALNLALDTDAFNTCLDNDETADLVKADLKSSLRQGIKGTPSFSVNGKVLKLGSGQEEIIKAIDDALKVDL